MVDVSKEKQNLLTLKRLKELLHYNPETGVFIRAISIKGYKIGSIAGTLINGYSCVTIDKERYKAHRVAWFYSYGFWPNQIDHINHVRSDNRLCNLRNTDTHNNGKNLSKAKNNTSGVTGVCWVDGRNKWIAQIGLNDNMINLGRFEDKFEAICARLSANNKHNFHTNHGK